MKCSNSMEIFEEKDHFNGNNMRKTLWSSSSFKTDLGIFFNDLNTLTYINIISYYNKVVIKLKCYSTYVALISSIKCLTESIGHFITALWIYKLFTFYYFSFTYYV